MSLRATLAYIGSVCAEPRSLPDGYRNLFDLVAKEGEAFEPRRLPGGYRRARIGDCGANAARDAFGNALLTYVEGFALHCSAPIPILHAWCVDPGGRVIERTWDFDPETEYLGLRIPTDELRRWRAEAGSALSILWPYSDPLEEAAARALGCGITIRDWPAPRERWPELVASHRALSMVAA